MKIKLYNCFDMPRSTSVAGHIQHTLGLGYLQTNITTPGWTAEVVYRREDLRNCDLIGLSANCVGAREATSIVQDSDIPVIIGGPLTLWDGIYNYDFKHIVLSEGEIALNEILQGSTERVIRKPLIEDLDTLKFPSRIISPKMTGAAHSGGSRIEMAMITSRGCPYSCKYCCTRQTWGNCVRFHSAEYIIDDIKNSLKQCPQLNSIRIEDDLFVVNRKRLEQLHGLWLREGFHKKLMMGYVAVMSKYFDDDVAQMLQEMNVKQTRIGAESLDHEVLTILGKTHTTEDDIQRVVDISEKHGMIVLVYMMWDIPGQRPEHVNHSIEFMKRNPRVKIDWMRFRPFPGSPLYDGREVLQNDWYIGSAYPPEYKSYIHQLAVSPPETTPPGYESLIEEQTAKVKRLKLL